MSTDLQPAPSLTQYRPQSPTPDSPPATPPLGDGDEPSSKAAYETPHYPSRSAMLPNATHHSSNDSPESVAGPTLVMRDLSRDSPGDEPVVHPLGGESGRGESYSPPATPYTLPDKTLSVDPSRWSSSHLDTSSGSSRSRSGSGSRSRSTSPLPISIPSLDSAPGQNAFASSSTAAPYPHYRPSTSPTHRTKFAHHDTPGFEVASPAADGKKEPSIRPFGLGISEPLDKTWFHEGHARPRAAYSSATPGHPLSAGGNVTLKPNYRGPIAQGAEGKGKVPFTNSVGYWLGLYFAFNLGLTLFNKMVLVSFPFPYTLTGLHALSGCAGCWIALERGAFTPAHLTSRENLILAAFSVLYTINIAVSNISLQLVTVPFHQVVRASTPIFTIIISAMLLRSRFTWFKLVSLLPVVAGVGLATYGDYYFTAWGLILTLIGTFLAALKTVVTNLIQTGGGSRLKLHPLDLLMRMSPLAFIQCVVYGWYTGELDRVRTYGATQMTREKAVALLFNGIIACGLNIVSFTANKKAGALTMTVSANCKQVITIALAVVLFDLSISFTNGVGILLTLIGGGWYGYVEYQDKKQKTAKIRN